MPVEPFIIAPPGDFLQRHPDLQPQARALSQAYEEHRLVEEQHLKTVGSALWNALQLDEALEQAEAARGQAALPIVIESNDAAILALPWETLYHPCFGFLGRASGFTLSRRNPDVQAPLPEPRPEPLRILLFTSLPDDLGEQERLEIEAEQAAVQEALMSLEQQGLIELEMPDDGRLQSFRDQLHEFRPQLVYMSGHGAFTHEPHNRRAWGSFLFEDEWGNKALVDEQELADCFHNTGVQLLVLSACLSARQHPDHPGSGLSETLYRHGIPHVIGMRESVFDAAGIQFAGALMRAIGARQPVDVALQQARAAILQPLQGEVYRNMTDPARIQAAHGQWCLPQLVSHELRHPLTDWSFTPSPRQRTDVKERLDQISLPRRFIGRRRELRRWQNRLRRDQGHRLLITGAGGMGKTALAGKLLETLSRDGYQVYAFSLRPEHDWRARWLDLELALMDNETLHKKYQLIQTKGLAEAEKIQWLLRLLSQLHHGKLALFFDNLESVQATEAPHAVTGPSLQAWLDAARRLSEPQSPHLKLIVTSRWRLPEWDERDHLTLARPVFGDYLAFARRQSLPRTFIENSERMRRTWQTLGGNFRALEFFAKAVQNMPVKEEEDFLARLAEAEAEIQTDMALEAVVGQRNPKEKALLERLLAYQTPVPLDGIRVIFDSVDTETLLERLLAVSLVEPSLNPHTGQTEYQLSPLVRSWLTDHGAQTPTPEQRQHAARYLLWLWDEDQNTTWEHLMTTHAALRDAGLDEPANRLVLDWIAGPLTLAGQYPELIEHWLSPTLQSQDQKTRSEALNQMGMLHYYVGDYDTALDYLEQALAITQEIGDKASEGTTLNNISQIYSTRGDYDTALKYLEQSLAIQRAIGDKVGEGTTLNNLAGIIHTHGDYDTALEYLEQSLAITQEIGNRANEGTTLNNISRIYSARSDYGMALKYLKRSLAIQQEIGNKSGESITLHNISQIYSAYGDYDTALEYIKQSLAIAQEIGDKTGEGTTLNNLAGISRTRGDYDTALEHLKQSLAIQQEIGNKPGESETLNNIWQIYYARSDYDTALKYLKRSLAIQQEIGDKFGEGRTLNNLAGIARARGDYDTALEYLEKSLAIQQKIGDKAGGGLTLNNISQIHSAHGDYDTALKYLEQSLAIQQEIGDVSGLCPTLFNMGYLHLQNGEIEKAFPAWVTVYRLAKPMKLTQALNALERLARQLYLPGGLQAWEALSRQEDGG